MATRSYVCKKIGMDKYCSIYIHWDGYPSYVGNVLLNNYNDMETLEELLKGGNVSSLKKKINPDPDSVHSFDNPQDDVTVFYGRDRGEKEQDAMDRTKEEMLHSGVDYIYIFQNNQWYFMDADEETSSVLEVNLKEYLEKHDERSEEL